MGEQPWIDATKMDWDNTPGRVLVWIEGWQEHSGTIWGRWIWGECRHSGRRWDDSDVRRLLDIGDMAGGEIMYWQRMPAVDFPPDRVTKDPSHD